MNPKNQVRLCHSCNLLILEGESFYFLGSGQMYHRVCLDKENDVDWEKN